MPSELGSRLLEERTRLGLSQEQFAALGEVSRFTQANYETGYRTPGAEYLAGLLRNGVDIGYVLIGTRGAITQLRQDQSHLLSNYEGLDDHHRDLLKGIVRVLKKA